MENPEINPHRHDVYRVGVKAEVDKSRLHKIRNRDKTCRSLETSRNEPIIGAIQYSSPRDVGGIVEFWQEGHNIQTGDHNGRIHWVGQQVRKRLRVDMQESSTPTSECDAEGMI